MPKTIQFVTYDKGEVKPTAAWLDRMHWRVSSNPGLLMMKADEARITIFISGLQSGDISWLIVSQEVDSALKYREGMVRKRGDGSYDSTLVDQLNKGFTDLLSHWHETLLPNWGKG